MAARKAGGKASLARRIGVSRQTIIDYCKGKHSPATDKFFEIMVKSDMERKEILRICEAMAAEVKL
jgi:DNA-binding XRE family transcriptional regulator